MEFLTFFQAVSKKDKEQVAKTLVQDSTPDFDFYMMTVLAILMASFGVILNSEAVIIGSMLIAPIMSPILALSLGLVTNSAKLIMRSALTLARVVFWALSFSFAVALVFASSDIVFFESVTSRIKPDLLHLAVAILSGLAVSYALVKPQLSASLPGVAVAVSLMPPLAVSGIGLAAVEPKVFAGAFLLFLANMVGIVLVAVVAFFLMDLQSLKGYIDALISQEEKRVEKEKELSKQLANEFKQEVASSIQETEGLTDSSSQESKAKQ